jgi:predicted  nucleic acid-binding Zn-ribbon protein
MSVFCPAKEINRMNQLMLLWELQEIEQEKSKKEYDLQNMASLLHYREKLKLVKSLENKLQQKEEEISGEKKAQRVKELEMAKIAEQMKELHDKLYDGKTGKVKELENMEKKIHLLEKESGLQEDGIIQHMEATENLEAESGRLQQLLQQEKDNLQKLKVKAQRERLNVQNEVAALSDRSDDLAAKIEAGLLQKYRELSKRNKGNRCISLFQDGFCGICNVSLPSAFLNRLQNPGELVYCENCASLLVLAE